MKALLDGIYTLFTAAPGGTYNTFYVAVGGRMYLARAKQGETIPYVTYHLITDTNDWNFSHDFETALIQFNIFHTSSTSAGTILGYLETLYDDCTLSVTGWTNVFMQREFTQLIRFDEENLWMYVVQYRVLLQKVRT